MGDIVVTGDRDELGSFKMYSIFAKAGESTLSFNLLLSDAQVTFFTDRTQMHFTIGHAMMIAFDKEYLDEWSIELVQ